MTSLKCPLGIISNWFVTFCGYQPQRGVTTNVTAFVSKSIHNPFCFEIKGQEFCLLCPAQFCQEGLLHDKAKVKREATQIEVK